MMTNNEMSRLRRQMRQRIRDVVAERRLARQNDPARSTAAEQTQTTIDSAISEGSLVGS
ncbi:hypothetical protein GCM10027290_58180 [Micromonospora sonneratiae]|uniref:Uncharacterized protein n=1 Tax=Micromonospora sonneratiae TaxID=1184706 RepID=A0ABW3YPG5_9ACTN